MQRLAFKEFLVAKNKVVKDAKEELNKVMEAKENIALTQQNEFKEEYDAIE